MLELFCFYFPGHFADLSILGAVLMTMSSEDKTLVGAISLSSTCPFQCRRHLDEVVPEGMFRRVCSRVPKLVVLFILG